MQNFNCEICDYSTNKPSNLLRHEKSVSHIRLTSKFGDSLHKLSTDQKNCKPKSTECQPIVNRLIGKKITKSKFICDKCGDEFGYRQSLSRHKKYRCKTNKTNKIDSASDIESIDEKPKKKNKDTKCKNDILAKKEKEIDDMREQIKQLLNLVTVTSQTSNINAKSSNKSLGMFDGSLLHFIFKNVIYVFNMSKNKSTYIK